jgi:hypothetical protein
MIDIYNSNLMLNNIIYYLINDVIYDLLMTINIEDVIFAYFTYQINI